MVQSRDAAAGKRLRKHIANGTTDRADDLMRLPVSYYLDPVLWQREMDQIFKRLPLMLAFSSELRGAGAYKAIDVVGVPVLMMRGRDGQLRAFLNVCSHRGSRLKPEGLGDCRRIVCPYHAWTYDDAGSLVGVYKSELFGDIDRSTKGLIPLHCEEHAGLVFVVLTPGRVVDVASYLGDMLEELTRLGIDGWHVYARRELTSANWKATHDGYVDGYHLEVLHPKSVGLFTRGAVNTFEFFGPHQRIGFANQQDDGFGFVRTLFPNVSLAVREAGGLVSQLLPGPTPDRSRTLQTFLRAKLPESHEEKRRADQEVELFYTAVRDEDYVTVDGVQQGMESGAIDEVIFGRNEPGNQRLHESIDHYTKGSPL